MAGKNRGKLGIGLPDPDPDLSKKSGSRSRSRPDPIFVEILSPSRYLAHGCLKDGKNPDNQQKHMEVVAVLKRKAM